ENPSERELELQVQLEESKQREAELAEKLNALQAEHDLVDLKATAKELKIAGYTKMDAEELKLAISVAGGDGDGK
ncbi:MAG: hypothetical protein K6T85_16385, partial [Gorillibacterium sp.]|nr:hypothetical protein [Gorillibacterium sp.]